MKNEHIKNTDSLGSRIKRIRLNHGLTVQEFADKLDSNKSSVSKWENDLTVPSIEFLKGIADLGELTVNELLGLEHSSTEHYTGYDISEILRGSLPVSYNGKLLTAKEKVKLNAIVEAFLK